MAWPPPKTTTTIVDNNNRPAASSPYKSPQIFATREAHEAALETARQLSERGIPEVKDLVPSLTRPLDVVVAEAALGRPSAFPGWDTVELETGDPRTYWRGQDRRKGLAKILPGSGTIIISGMRNRLGSQARLVSCIAPIVAHDLVRVASGEPVCFDDPHDATRRMDGLIAADGGLPAVWAWTTPLHNPQSQPQWTVDPAPLLGRSDDMAAIWWRGARGRWLITSAHGTARVWRNRWPVLDANGQPATFGSVIAAKHFCETEDMK